LLTGSISPIIEDVTKWYGQYYIESCPELFDPETLPCEPHVEDESIELSAEAPAYEQEEELDDTDNEDEIVEEEADEPEEE